MQAKRYLKKYQNKPTQKPNRQYALYERHQLAMATANLNANKDGIWKTRDRQRVEATQAKLNTKLGVSNNNG